MRCGWCSFCPGPPASFPHRWQPPLRIGGHCRKMNEGDIGLRFSGAGPLRLPAPRHAPESRRGANHRGGTSATHQRSPPRRLPYGGYNEHHARPGGGGHPGDHRSFYTRQLAKAYERPSGRSTLIWGAELRGKPRRSGDDRPPIIGVPERPCAR